MLESSSDNVRIITVETEAYNKMVNLSRRKRLKATAYLYVLVALYDDITTSKSIVAANGVRMRKPI